jgi:hypothetical protein
MRHRVWDQEIVWNEGQPIDQLDGTYAHVDTATVDEVYLTWMGDRVHGITEGGTEWEIDCSKEDRDKAARELVIALRRQESLKNGAPPC